ncbi:hypothetical protein GF382_02860 [Candidatus Falkowbacteria bacterium]|nr:hypothetical protein [Candidatus Falkowbacteria bacterium]
MQMFTVPQFIDAEDKIIGALTVRQFIISLAGFIFIAIAYKIFDLGLFILVAILCFIVFGALAFVKINGRPFHYFLLNFIQTSKKPRLRVWNHKNSLKDLAKDEDDQGEALQETANKKIVSRKDLPKPRLNELSLIVDTKGVYKGGDEEAPEIISKK